MNDIWNAKRKKLEKDLIDVALNLFQHTGSVGFKIPIPNTQPKVFIVAGDERIVADDEKEETSG